MDRLRKIKHKYYRLRNRYYRDSRMIFPSPAEIQFIRLMGGYVLRVPFVKHYQTGFAFAIVLTMGRELRHQNVTREVRVGHKWVDFGNDIQRGIEVDGEAFHNDVVAEYERAEYFKERGWQVIHIPARDVFQQPTNVRTKVLKFLDA